MLNFPNAPTLNQECTFEVKTWKWNGSAWDLLTISDAQVLLAEQAAVEANASAVAAAASAALAQEGPGGGDILNATLTGFSAATNAPVTAANSVLTGFGYLQAQVTALLTALGLLAPKDNPTFTGTVSGVSKAMVGLSNVDNTTDVDKPVSTAQSIALALKANASAITNVNNTSDAEKPISNATQTALNLKASTAALTSHETNLANPHGVTKAQVALSNVDNTSDAAKPVSTAQAAAIALVNTTLVPNAQVGTAYTLVLADAGKRVSMTNATVNTVTIPPNSAVAFPVNTTLFISQDGAGATSIAPGVGVTINTADGLKVGGQYKMISILKTGTDTWMGIGSVA